MVCIFGLCVVGWCEIMKCLYEIGGCFCNVSRGFCCRISFEVYLFVVLVDEWSGFY